MNLPIHLFFGQIIEKTVGKAKFQTHALPKIMNTTHQGSRLHDQMLAMYDASEGAYQAARIRFEALKKQSESVSIDYVQGRIDRDQVRLVMEQYLAAESALSQAAERLRTNEELLSQLVIGD